MTVPSSAPASRIVTLPGGLSITIAEYGDPHASKGTGVLPLHGGAGPFSILGLATALSQDSYVIAPTHPGFDGTVRPEWCDTVADIASAYLDLLDALNLTDVLVIGSSVGGWIAAEMAVRDNHKVLGAVTLVNAAGIKAEPGQEIASVAALSPAEIGKLSFYNPRFRPDLAALTDQQRAAMAANQRTLAVYAGNPYMHDPKLRGRLHRIDIPALVVWGEQDGVIPLEYGRTLAASIPESRFVPIPQAGHFPFIENPDAFFKALGDFTATEAKDNRESVR
jgi:pimeloyl-ACP methyl ester carboxylesterase